MAIPKTLLTATVSHLAVISRKVIWGPELCDYTDMLLVKQNIFCWSSATIASPSAQTHQVVAPSSAQSIHSKEEQVHRYLAPELLSFAVQHSHCSSSLAEQYGWLPKSEPLAARRQSSLLQCLSCVQKIRLIFITDSRGNSWWFQKHDSFYSTD